MSLNSIAARDTVTESAEAKASVTPVRRLSSAPWLRKTLLHVGFIAVVLGLWELLSGPVLDPFFVSRPQDVAAAFWDWLASASFPVDLGATLEELFFGFLIGAGLGTLLAFVLSELPRVRAFFSPYISALYGVPKSALAPLLIVWFGVGIMPKVVLSASLVFFLMFYNTLHGLLSIDQNLLDLVRMNGASRRDTWRTLKIPAAFPFWVTGARVAMPLGLVGAVIGEFISSDRGVGFRILQAGNFFRTADVFAGIIVLSLVVLLLSVLLGWFEKRFTRWRLPTS